MGPLADASFDLGSRRSCVAVPRQPRSLMLHASSLPTRLIRYPVSVLKRASNNKGCPRRRHLCISASGEEVLESKVSKEGLRPWRWELSDDALLAYGLLVGCLGSGCAASALFSSRGIADMLYFVTLVGQKMLCSA